MKLILHVHNIDTCDPVNITETSLDKKLVEYIDKCIKFARQKTHRYFIIIKV